MKYIHRSMFYLNFARIAWLIMENWGPFRPSTHGLTWAHWIWGIQTMFYQFNILIVHLAYSDHDQLLYQIILTPFKHISAWGFYSSRLETGMKHNKFFRVMFCYVLCQIFYSSVMLCSVMWKSKFFVLCYVMCYVFDFFAKKAKMCFQKCALN